MKSNIFFILLCIGLITMITVASILALVVINQVNGQQITIEQPDSNDNLENQAIITNLSISFDNGTKATLNDTTISQDRGDYLIGILNIVLAGAAEDELPTYSQVELEDILAQEQAQLEAELLEEPETNIEEDSDGNNNDDGDNGDNGDDEPEPPDDNDTDPIITDPIIIEPPFEGSGDGGGPAILTEGCGNGFGYYETGKQICYPIDKIGEDPPEGVAFCTALGCPFNPPSR